MGLKKQRLKKKDTMKQKIASPGVDPIHLLVQETS